LEQLLSLVKPQRHDAWLALLAEWMQDDRNHDFLNGEDNGQLSGAHVVHDIWEATNGQAVIVTDVGQHQMLASQYYPNQRSESVITSGGLGTMGFGLPAAIGAKLGRPDDEVWAIVGDGGFQMTQAELATAAQEEVKVNIAIINNGYLGMVRQWQEFFYEERYVATPLRNPDFCMLAKANDIPAMRVTSRAQVAEAIEWARSTAGPVLVDFVVEPGDNVYPMVPTGASLHEMIRRPKPPVTPDPVPRAGSIRE
jgi:acetolactate synthase-1/2/3 large subunit